MKFTIVIYAAPYSSQAANTALQFCHATLAAGHEIYRLFFYQDGVHNSNTLSVPPQDEPNLSTQWQTLISAHNIDAVSCVSSALKRGVLDAGEAERYEKPCASMDTSFTLSGLGQLADACIHSDRVISFGV